MALTPRQQHLLRQIPGVDHILELVLTAGKTVDFDPRKIPRSVLTRSARSVADDFRQAILKEEGFDEKRLSDEDLLFEIRGRIEQEMRHNLIPLINATGVVVHTNLGRSLLPREAIENICAVAGQYSNLEFDLARGERGSRYTAVEEILCEISGAEAAMVVNNNAGAVLLCLETLAAGKKVIVSRGELVEIGGAFRIPDVMARSGCILVEVGSTNRTHLRDYEGAIDADTGLLLKVHKSNYTIVGFTKEVAIDELAGLGRSVNLPVMEDLGSGTFIDFSRYGLAREPTVQDSVGAGADIVTFSGDKLLGGPQAGIILGKKEYIDRIKKNPITRALRIDKLTLAGLESVLRLYRDPQKAVEAIPTLKAMTSSYAEISLQAQALAETLGTIEDPNLKLTLTDLSSRAGGGALPLQNLPSRGVAVEVLGISANALEKRFRKGQPPLIGRIENDLFIMDPRTIEPASHPLIRSLLEGILKTSDEKQDGHRAETTKRAPTG